MQSKYFLAFLLLLMLFSNAFAQEAQIISVKKVTELDKILNALFGIISPSAIVSVPQFTTGQTSLPPVTVTFALTCKDFYVADSCTADWCNALRNAPWCVPSEAPNNRTKVRCLPYTADLTIRNSQGQEITTQQTIISQSIRSQFYSSTEDNCGQYQMTLQLPQMTYPATQYTARVKLFGKWNSQYTTAQVVQPIDDGIGDFAVQPGCTEGAKYCDSGNSIRRCQNGSFVTDTVCSAPNYSGCVTGSTVCTSASGTSQPILNGTCYINEINSVKCDTSSLHRTVKCTHATGQNNNYWTMNQSCTVNGCQAGNSTCNQPPQTQCGNGTCESGETIENCSADCQQATQCGNGTCDADETVDSCQQDCTVPPEQNDNCPETITSDWETVGCFDGLVEQQRTITEYIGADCTATDTVEEQSLEPIAIGYNCENNECQVIKDWHKIACSSGFEKQAKTISCNGVEKTQTQTNREAPCNGSEQDNTGIVVIALIAIGAIGYYFLVMNKKRRK